MPDLRQRRPQTNTRKSDIQSAHKRVRTAHHGGCHVSVGYRKGETRSQILQIAVCVKGSPDFYRFGWQAVNCRNRPAA